MKIFKKTLAALLCLIIAFVGLPFVASAEAEGDYIYLSDIYCAYPSYISKSAVLDNYCDDNIEIMYVALENYLNSDAYEDTEVKSVLINNPSNIKNYIQMFLSGYFGANYVKDDAIDLANELFVQSMFNTNSVEATNIATDFGDKVIKLCEVFEEFSTTVDEAELIDSEILETALSMLQSSNILKSVSSSEIQSFLNELIPNLKTASGIATFGGDMIKLGKTLMLAVMLEDVRLDCVKAALNNAPNESTFYVGMNRLYEDMSANFGSYLYDNYVVNGLLEKLEDAVIDKISDSVLGSVSGLVSLVGLAFEVAGYVAFPNTPDLNQIMLQIVLTEYVNGMQSAVYAFDNKFDSEQFAASDISTHKALMLSLKTLTDLALQKTKPLAVVQADLNTINTLRNKYNANYDLYTSVMNDTRSIISDIPVGERKRAYHNVWIISKNTTASYGSDTVTDDKLYFTDGVFDGNVSVSKTSTLNIPADMSGKINGSLNLHYNNASLVNKGNLEIVGDSGAVMLDNYSSSSFENFGTLTVGGSLNVWRLSNYENATIKVAGDYYERETKAGEGTIILNGTVQQTVRIERTKNLYVLNKAGIKYEGSFYLTGEYFLNGNPLDDGGWSTIASSPEVKFDSISDYKEITILTDLILSTNIKANIYIQSGDLTIPEDKSVIIDGSTRGRQYYGCINVDGDLTITGNSDSDKIRVNGSLTVYGNFSTYTVSMDKDDAIITVGGNFSVGNSYYNGTCDITAGTVILNGTVQQEVYELRCHNLIVTNNSGIKYNRTVYVTGDYLLNGNPLDNNGYSTIASSSQVRFDLISDYKEVSVGADLVLPSSIKANIYIQRGTLTIPEDKSVVMNGSLSGRTYDSTLDVKGELTITGNSDSHYTQVDGNLTVCGNFSTYSIYMDNSDSAITVGGNWYVVNNYGITNGEVILNGTAEQTVYNIGAAPIIILENESESGVVFNNSIYPNVLFNHNGNKFTLYENGYGSKFADFDGDKVTDEKDDNPTVFSNKNYCETVCDVTNDGKTNVLDFIDMMKNSVNGSMGDINLDGNCDANDLIYVKKVLLGIFVLPIGA